jgi:hypothetical protein
LALADFRILGQHTANQIADNRWQPFVRSQGAEAAKSELAPHDRCIVQLAQRRTPERKAEKQDAQCVNIISDGALTAPGGETHR